MRLKSGARRFCSVVDGLHVRPPVIPALARRLDGSALSAVGGRLPVPTSEFAARAYRHALDPLRNPLKEVMDAFTSVWAMPPMLGIFNDIAADKMREDEVKSWARAGFTWVVNDGEHSQIGGRATHETNAMLLRNGLLPIQRLHREAISEHGDAFQLGARATMRPYASTYEEAEQYYRAIRLPSGRPGTASPDARGGFPVRLADRQPTYTPAAMRAVSTWRNSLVLLLWPWTCQLCPHAWRWRAPSPRLRHGSDPRAPSLALRRRRLRCRAGYSSRQASSSWTHSAAMQSLITWPSKGATRPWAL